VFTGAGDANLIRVETADLTAGDSSFAYQISLMDKNES
jgi:hypothetical protein